MRKRRIQSFFILLIISISFGCKEENIIKHDISYKITAIIVEGYKYPDFDTIESSDTQSINIDRFLDSLRNDPFSSVPNSISLSNNDLKCEVIRDFTGPSSFSIFTNNNRITKFSLYDGIGGYGQYGSYYYNSIMTYNINKLYSLYFKYISYFPFEPGETRFKLFQFNYNNDLLISLTGIDSLYASGYNSYSKPVSCSITYANSYKNPKDEIGFDINDIVLNSIFHGHETPVNFIIQHLTTFSTQSKYLIEHAHYNYFNSNKYDISDKTLDVDISYTFDNLERVQSFTIKIYFDMSLVDKERFTIIYN
ncbi:MAG: hypothetical protein U0T69_01520 [Chitinophagales bacterium]